MGRWLSRRRRGAWLRGVLVVMVAAGLLIARGMGPGGEERARWDRRSLEVVEVVDGRTLRVRRNNGESAAVRLLGVAAEASRCERCERWLREAVSGGRVTLSFDADLRRDEANDLSAYVYLDDGRMINEWMIEQGLARHDPAVPHELREWFARLEGQARSRERGMWGERGG